MSLAGALGWGADPAGDAARRAGLSHALITPADLVRLRAREALPAASPPQADPDPVGHHLTYRAGLSGTEVTCECGRWDGWFNGARSRRRVLDDHACHVAAELAAAGPIIVECVRADQDEEPQ